MAPPPLCFPPALGLVWQGRRCQGCSAAGRATDRRGRLQTGRAVGTIVHRGERDSSKQAGRAGTKQAGRQAVHSRTPASQAARRPGTITEGEPALDGWCVFSECEVAHACSGRFVMPLGAPRVEQPGIKLGDDERAQTMHSGIASADQKCQNQPMACPSRVRFSDPTRTLHSPLTTQTPPSIPSVRAGHPHPPLHSPAAEPTIAESRQVPLGADGISRGIALSPDAHAGPPPSLSSSTHDWCQGTIPFQTMAVTALYDSGRWGSIGQGRRCARGGGEGGVWCGLRAQPFRNPPHPVLVPRIHPHHARPPPHVHPVPDQSGAARPGWGGERWSAGTKQARLFWRPIISNPSNSNSASIIRGEGGPRFRGGCPPPPKVLVARPGLFLMRIRHGGLQAAQDGADLMPRRDSDKDSSSQRIQRRRLLLLSRVFQKSCNRSMVPPLLPSLPLDFPTRPGVCIFSASAPVSLR